MRRRRCVVTVAVTTILAGALLFGHAGAADVRMGGTFVMNDIEGLCGEDLYPIVWSENSWTVVFHDVWYECEEVFGEPQSTLRASSFEFEFLGPEADLLNSVVGSQLNQGWHEGDDYFRVVYHPEDPSAYFFFGTRSDAPGEGVCWAVEGDAGADEFPPDSVGCPTIGAFGQSASLTVLCDHRGANAGWFEAAGSSDIWLELLTPMSESSWGAVKALYR